ncbi:hypothetical protein ACFXPX_41390, partial [Kitasatospora sp. NPDC059146]|uniref:hypothetical protein n=1 Tax=Kitasatospora sp. NPDC059146 TaxID=3346741 RepID=UPI003689D9C1
MNTLRVARIRPDDGRNTRYTELPGDGLGVGRMLLWMSSSDGELLGGGARCAGRGQDSVDLS